MGTAARPRGRPAAPPVPAANYPPALRPPSPPSLGAVAAALIFGFADNLQGVLTITGTPIPSEFMLMAPYIATIIAVSGFVGRVRAPAADGVAYKRGGGSH